MNMFLNTLEVIHVHYRTGQRSCSSSRKQTVTVQTMVWWACMQLLLWFVILLSCCIIHTRRLTQHVTLTADNTGHSTPIQWRSRLGAGPIIGNIARLDRKLVTNFHTAGVCVFQFHPPPPPPSASTCSQYVCPVVTITHLTALTSVRCLSSTCTCARHCGHEHCTSPSCWCIHVTF